MSENLALPPLAAQAPLAAELEELPLPYLEIDAQGRVLRANCALQAIHHPGYGSLIGKSAWELLATDEKKSSQEAFQKLMEVGNEPPVITRNILVRSGSFRTYQFHRSLIRDAEGKPAGVRMIGVDVTETSRALEESRRTCQWLESAMGSVAEVILLADILGVITAVNRAAEEFTGLTAKELVGKTIEEALPALRSECAGGIQLTHNAVIEGHCKCVATILDRQGQKMRVEISTAPVHDKCNGPLIGVVIQLREIEAAGMCSCVTSPPATHL